jgi:hypothetical protein
VLLADPRAVADEDELRAVPTFPLARFAPVLRALDFRAITDLLAARVQNQRPSTPAVPSTPSIYDAFDAFDAVEK